MPGSSAWNTFFRSFFYYTTTKVVQIRSWKLGLLHYTIMAGILFYVGFYAIYWSKGYQTSGDLIGNVAVKVKGNGFHNETNGNITIWDTYDVVYPPQEANALFVTTNFLSTPQQHRRICNGTDVPTESCALNDNCTSLRNTLNGIDTGVCGVNGFCDIYAWCPLEDATQDPPNNIIQGIDDFTIFIRVTAKFPKFGVTVDNTNGTKNSSQPTVPNDYNLWVLSTILSRAGGYVYDDFSLQGGVVAVVIKFDCNLDFSPSNCKPQISFDRIDETSNGNLGYNFRYASYYWLPDVNGQLVEYRDLLKVYGIRFIFLVSGQAGKFDFVPLLINIGSGLALLSIATLVSDMITLYVLPDRKFYNAVKYDSVEGHEIERWEEERRKKKLLLAAADRNAEDVGDDEEYGRPMPAVDASRQQQQQSVQQGGKRQGQVTERTPLVDSTRF